MNNPRSLRAEGRRFFFFQSAGRGCLPLGSLPPGHFSRGSVFGSILPPVVPRTGRWCWPSLLVRPFFPATPAYPFPPFEDRKGRVTVARLARLLFFWILILSPTELFFLLIFYRLFVLGLNRFLLFHDFQNSRV